MFLTMKISKVAFGNIFDSEWKKSTQFYFLKLHFRYFVNHSFHVCTCVCLKSLASPWGQTLDQYQGRQKTLHKKK